MTTNSAKDKNSEGDYDLVEEIDNHLRRLFYIKPKAENPKLNPYVVEFFGVLSLTDLRAPQRKLWVIYYAKQPDLDKTVDEIHEKYGKKNMFDMYRTPVFSGAALRDSVKKHFSNLKWFTKGNLLEAPPKSHFNDERVVKTITDLHHLEHQRLYNYVMVKNMWFSRYR
ncbi:uncharacterized protein LOC6549395 [Drosophila erecta]|uniref:Uncharacterized protein n=1 Tax=Drosophila erecta TaxID=7220 RepID=B3NR24_DROER|nr:uncharacterized protein LOC6549395 [Drosophila erecta]EDV56013.2 uncharacterized protein Dere_GG22414 [Drosophila erecta]